MIKSILFKVGQFVGLLELRISFLNIIYRAIMSGKASMNLVVDDISQFSIDSPVFIEGGKNIFIHSGHIRMFARLSAISSYKNKPYYPVIKIGKDANIGVNNHIGAINKIVIGNHFLSGANCLITDHTHGSLDIQRIDINTGNKVVIPPNERDLISKGPVIIGDNVHIGENVVILPNVTIGNNVLIGAGSVVTKNIPDNCIACGNPVQIIKQIIL